MSTPSPAFASRLAPTSVSIVSWRLPVEVNAPPSPVLAAASRLDSPEHDGEADVALRGDLEGARDALQDLRVEPAAHREHLREVAIPRAAIALLYEGRAISILAMFHLGAYVGKARLYVDRPANARVLRRAFAWCAPIGLLGNLVLVPLHAATPAYPPTPSWLAEQVLFALAVPALAVAYASGFALLYAGPARAWLRAFAPAGRMALTTYISQTCIGIAVFYGVGLGLRDTFGQAAFIAIGLAIFSAQSVLAALWLRRFRFGPLEWCWRRAAYGVPVPFARSVPHCHSSA